MNIETSGYVLAGLETFGPLVNKFFSSTEFKNQFTREDLSDFFSKTCNKFLHSFGASFKGRKKYDKYIEKEANLLKSCRETGLFDKSEFICDSGGFQISVGLLNDDEGKILHKLYHEFLEQHVDLYDKAFLLDLVPGPNCQMFESFDDVYNYNMKSYLKAQSLPEKVRDKLIYIHHFRTPKLWDIFTNILDQDGMFESFKHYATGGIVANMASDVSIPCIIYILPLIPLLKRTIKFNRKVLDFHILGGASFRDVFFYEVFRIHIMKKFGIQLNITFDSSSIFKGLLMGRYIHVCRNDGSIHRLDLRSNALDLKCQSTDQKSIDIYHNCMNQMSEDTNLTKMLQNDIYNQKTNSFHEEVNIYLMLFVLYTYSKAQTIFKELAQKLYLSYETEDVENFNKDVSLITKNINSGKITKKQISKSNSLWKSLDTLTSLDEDYCKFLVKKYLSKDEFVHLLNDKCMNA